MAAMREGFGHASYCSMKAFGIAAMGRSNFLRVTPRLLPGSALVEGIVSPVV